MEHNNSAKNELNIEEGWVILQEEAINKLIDSFEADPHRQFFTSEQYMRFYTIVYQVCSPNPIGPDAQRLYDNYKKTFEDYIYAKVLPSLQGKMDEVLLQELLKQWKKFKIMTYWLSRFFHYVERYLINRKELPTLKGTSYLVFHEHVYGEFNDQIRGVVLSMIRKERSGIDIDQALVKNVLDIYIEMGEDSVKYYENDFEEAMLDDASSFYSSEAMDWISAMSYDDYMLKVQECLNQEKDRITAYLGYNKKFKLLEVLEKELLSVHESKLKEKMQLQES